MSILKIEYIVNHLNNANAFIRFEICGRADYFGDREVVRPSEVSTRV